MKGSKTMTHWKLLTNPEYLGAYALEGDKKIIATIKKVGREMVTGPDGKKEECIVAHFVEDVKPMILNVTNCKVITKIYKTPYIEEWGGRKIEIRKENVRAFGDIVEALRITPTIPKVTVKDEKTYVCADCGATIKAVGNHSASELAQRSQDRFGKVLCVECGKKAAEDKTKEDVGEAEATELLNSLAEGAENK